MKVTLLRHAQVDAAYLGCYNGHNDITLSNEGRVQASALGAKLDISSFDAIYASDLRRCRETLEAFYPCDDVIYTQTLREKSWGRHEGLTFDQVVAMEGEGFKSFSQWLGVLDGEDYHLYIQRVASFFFEYLPSQKHQNLLIVTHAGVIRVLIHLLDSISLEDAFARKIDYGAWITLDLKPSKKRSRCA